MADTIYSKEEIIAGLREASSEVITWISDQEASKFALAVDGKWTTGQQLDHMIKSIKPIAIYINNPRAVMRLTFGVSNRDTRTYADVVKKYNIKLGAGGVAPKRFAPKEYSIDEKRALIDKYSEFSDKLVKRVNRLSEKDLDKFVLPHPLLGKLPLREMMFFTIHHTYHHFNSLKSLYSSAT